MHLIIKRQFLTTDRTKWMAPSIIVSDRIVLYSVPVQRQSQERSLELLNYALQFDRSHQSTIKYSWAKVIKLFPEISLF